VLLAPDYALPLAASGRLRRAPDRTSSPLKISCRGSALRPSGRTCLSPIPSRPIATGCTEYAYKTASGRSNFLNRDPIEEAGGINLYGFVNNDPANAYDVLGDDAWSNYANGMWRSIQQNNNRVQGQALGIIDYLENVGGIMGYGGDWDTDWKAQQKQIQ